MTQQRIFIALLGTILGFSLTGSFNNEQAAFASQSGETNLVERVKNYQSLLIA